MCEILGVSRAAYYKHKNRQISDSEIKNHTLIEEIIHAYNSVKGIYGYRRMTIYLNHFRGLSVNHKRVYRLMKYLNLKAVIRRKRYNRKRVKPDFIYENILNRQFYATKPMEVLLTDITEFKLSNGKKLYLSAVLDIYTNKIVAYEMGPRMTQSLVNNTFKQIYPALIFNETLIHTDRGAQYTSASFKHIIETQSMKHSMSRPGKCIDNGPMENIWGILKEECFRVNIFDTIEELKEGISTYIHFFNTQRVTLKMRLTIPNKTLHISV